MTLYLQPPPSDAPRLRPLIRLIINQTCRALMEHLETDHAGRKKRHRLLLLLDEFPTLGRLEFFTMNLRQMAGYGIKAHLIVQSFNDIIEAYGPHNTILDNCHLLAAFGSADPVTCQKISQMTGTVVEYRESHSGPQNRWVGGHWTVGQAEQVRPLLQPGDVRTFPPDEELIFITGYKPIRCKRLRYYESPYFKPRLLPAPVQNRLGMPTAPCDWLGVTAQAVRSPASPNTTATDGASTSPESKGEEVPQAPAVPDPFGFRK
jgi:type IV secretion system protein VirD4